MTAAITYSDELPKVGSDVYVGEGSVITLTLSNTQKLDRSSIKVTVNDNTTLDVDTWTHNADTSTATITVPKDTVYDNLTLVASNDEEGQFKDTVEIVAEERFIHDATAPTVSVATNVPEGNTTGYFAGVGTYTFTVTDNHMTKGVAALNLEYILEENGVQQDAVNVPMSDWTTQDGKTYTYELKVDDAKLVSYRVTGKDNVGNALTELSAEPNLICDDTAPAVNVSVTACTADEYKTDVSLKFFSRGGTVYLQVGDAIEDDGTYVVDEDEITIKATVTVTDKNLSATNCVTNITGDTGAWSGEVATNKDATLTYTKTINVKRNESGVLELDLTVSDCLKNAATNVTVDAVSGTNYPLPIELNNGQFALALNIDRRTPTSTEGEKDEEGNVQTDVKAPAITVNKAEGVTAAYTTAGEDGIEGFDVAPSFTFTVNDGTAESGNSGLAEVKYELINADGVTLLTGGTYFIKEYEDKDDDAGNVIVEYSDSFTVNTILANEVENNDVVLKITVKDAAGNTIVRSYPFAVDNQAPRVTFEQTNTTAYNEKYFAADQEITVTIEDLNFDATKSTVTTQVPFSGWTDLGNNKYSTTLTYDADGDYTFEMASTDLANNDADIDYTTGLVALREFTVDKTDPVITITKNEIDPFQSNETHDYYAAQVTYTVTASDTNFKEATLSYTIDGVTTEDALKSGEPKTITVNNDQVLTDIQVKVQDMASRYGKTDNSEFNFNEETGVWTYNGKHVVVDTDPAKVTLTKTADAYKQTHKNDKEKVDVDYYQGNVKYSLEISDKFMTAEEGLVRVELVYQNETKTLSIKDLTKSETANVYATEFEVVDGQSLQDIRILVQDNSGNVTETIACVDAEKLTSFDFDSATNVNDYAGNPIVVDTVKPQVEMTFSENVKSVYFNKETNTVYAILNKPVEAESGIFSALTGEEVTVTITVDDMNLAIDNENANGLQAKTFAWAGETPVNAKSTVTYTAKSGTVKADGTAVFEIDVAISDLAGNKPEAFDSKITTQDGTVLHVTPVEGAFAYTVSVDRLRPTSQSSDTAAPTITIEPSITPTKTADGLDLFNGAFGFDMNVTDGEKSNKNSGLASVKWTIEDGKDLVEVGELGREYAEQTFSDKFTINVPAPAVPGESNDITLTITAIDNVGNTIVFKKQFGVDTLAPRVTITQSNHSAQNDFYFNADQVVTVQIEDLNFDSTKSTVTTEVPFGGWQSLGENKYSTTLTYNTDGDYTFEMASTDLANNAATIDYTTGLVALQSFTIDKTAPVIHVNFNPFVPVDTDAAQVQYFDDVRTVTVTIDEHNFRAADVVANLGAANALGAWSSNGDSHSASEQFTQGNGYSVNVNYTDLAGNPAVAYTSPTFSVDMEAPTIVMNKGDMATGDLNIVSDDLLLGFAINDEQDNLKDFNIEVIFLSNEYQQSKVEGVEYYTVTDGDRTNGYIDFTNIESIKENDGIYTVRVSALDYAGHLVTFPDVVFSLNRFGSTFTVSDSYTSSFLTAGGSGVIYQNEVTAPLVITEINPNRVWQDAAQTTEGSAITVAANGSSVTLVAGEDYEVTVNEMGTGSNKWYEYTYTINPDVFNSNDELVDGEYTIFFYSEDEAGNKNTNESNEGSSLLLNADGNYSGKVSFNLDHKAPVVTVLNIEEGGQYVEANRNVEINISDNSPVTIAVYINDVLVEYVESAEGQPLTSDWLTYNAESGNYELNMSEKDEIQNVRVVVTDAAGNVFEQLIGDITLTENLWIQFINNEVMVIGSIVGGIGLFILIFLLLKKRKKEEEEPAEV